MDHRDLAADVVRRARAEGADAADVILAEGNDFSVTVRLGEVETLEQAGSKALGLRVFVGKRTALDLHVRLLAGGAARRWCPDTVAMARVTGEDAAAGLPDETPPAEDVELGDATIPRPPRSRPPSASSGRAARRRRRSQSRRRSTTRRARPSARARTRSCSPTPAASSAPTARSSVSLSVVPVAERDGQMQRDYWYSAGRGLGDLLTPEEVGRIAAERTLRRLGARQVPTCEVPIVFDPETAAEILGHLFRAISGYSVFRNATFLKDRAGRAGGLAAAHAWSTRAAGRAASARGPFDGEGLPTRRNVPIEKGVLRHFLCDSYAARKIGGAPGGQSRGAASAGGPGRRRQQPLLRGGRARRRRRSWARSTAGST